MTTTNIAGIEIDSDVIAVANECADTLDHVVPQLHSLLDRATAAMSEIELASLRQTEWHRSDEQQEAIYSQTPLKRLEDHFYALNERTEDANMRSAAFHAEDRVRT